EKVIGERRLRTLRDLASKCEGAEREQSVYDAAVSVLEANGHDVPFALIYRVDERRRTAQLKALAGIGAGSSASPPSVTLDTSASDVWSLGAVAQSGHAAVLTDLPARFDVLPTGVWKQSPHSALVLPILLPGQDRPRAILVAAVSPMRALDEDYRTFFGL